MTTRGILQPGARRPRLRSALSAFCVLSRSCSLISVVRDSKTGVATKRALTHSDYDQSGSRFSCSCSPATGKILAYALCHKMGMAKSLFATLLPDQEWRHPRRNQT
jgi:hypothetical protein